MELPSHRWIDWSLQIALQILAWLGPVASEYLEALIDRLTRNSNAYEVKDFRASLEILDAKGRRAVLTKQQRVRFLRDNVTSYNDYGWGSGDTFASHRAHPGHIVERRRVGPRFRSVVLLPEPQNRGDELTWSVRRLVRNSLADRHNWLEVEIYHKTRRAELRLTLPRARPIIAVRIVDRRREATNHVPARTLADGRIQARWTVSAPQVGDRYTLEWDW